MKAGFSGLCASADRQAQHSIALAWCARAAPHSMVQVSMFRSEIIKESSRVSKGSVSHAI